MLATSSPISQYFDLDGSPLDNGSIYFGLENQNPETAPVSVYWDAAGTQPAAQPVKTVNGYPLRVGAPASIFINGNYSVLVRNRQGRQVLYAASSADLSNASLLTQQIADLTANIDTTAAAAAANLLDFTQSGGSGVPISLDDKLKQFVSRAEFGSDAAFNAAKGTRPSIDGSANLDAKVTPAGEPTQGNLSDMLRPVAAGPRDAIVYNNATSVKVFRSHAVMGGFRFRGQYSKGRAPCFPMPTSKVASVSTGLGAESAVRPENWYAVFAVANAGDATATLKVMPYLRAGTVSGSNVPLIKAGEGIHALTAQTYAWSSVNNMAGTDCLVISEGGAFSGRVTTITANVAGQVTLGTIGSVAAYDFLLPAPPGFTHYVYLGSFYFDTAEVRNIADAGIVVKAKMVNLSDPNFPSSGAVASAVELRFGGYISPLAAAVVIKDSHTLSTASTGDHANYFWADSSNHEIQANYEKKTSSSSDTYVWDGVELPFSQRQSIWYLNGGTLAAQRSAANLEIKGWIEP
jgi:hypothetical protein